MFRTSQSRSTSCSPHATINKRSTLCSHKTSNIDSSSPTTTGKTGLIKCSSESSSDSEAVQSAFDKATSRSVAPELPIKGTVRSIVQKFGSLNGGSVVVVPPVAIGQNNGHVAASTGDRITNITSPPVAAINKSKPLVQARTRSVTVAVVDLGSTTVAPALRDHPNVPQTKAPPPAPRCRSTDGSSSGKQLSLVSQLAKKFNENSVSLHSTNSKAHTKKASSAPCAAKIACRRSPSKNSASLLRKSSSCDEISSRIRRRRCSTRRPKPELEPLTTVSTSLLQQNRSTQLTTVIPETRSKAAALHKTRSAELLQSTSCSENEPEIVENCQKQSATTISCSLKQSPADASAKAVIAEKTIEKLKKLVSTATVSTGLQPNEMSPIVCHSQLELRTVPAKPERKFLYAINGDSLPEPAPEQILTGSSVVEKPVPPPKPVSLVPPLPKSLPPSLCPDLYVTPAVAEELISNKSANGVEGSFLHSQSALTNGSSSDHQNFTSALTSFSITRSTIELFDAVLRDTLLNGSHEAESEIDEDILNANFPGSGYDEDNCALKRSSSDYALYQSDMVGGTMLILRDPDTAAHSLSRSHDTLLIDGVDPDEDFTDQSQLKRNSRRMEDSTMILLNQTEVDLNGHIYCTVHNGKIVEDDAVTIFEKMSDDEDPNTFDDPCARKEPARPPTPPARTTRAPAPSQSALRTRGSRSSIATIYDRPKVPPPAPPLKVQSPTFEKVKVQSPTVAATSKVAQETSKKQRRRHSATNIPATDGGSKQKQSDYAEVIYQPLPPQMPGSVVRRTSERSSASASSSLSAFSSSSGTTSSSNANVAFASSSTDLVGFRRLCSPTKDLSAHSRSMSLSFPASDDKSPIDADSMDSIDLANQRNHSATNFSRRNFNSVSGVSGNSSSKNMKRFARKFRPVSQQIAEDVGRLLKFRSNIQVNLAETVGKIKLKITSKEKRVDDLSGRSSTFYLNGGGTDSGGGAGDSSTVTANGGESLISPTPLPRTTSIHITLETSSSAPQTPLRASALPQTNPPGAPTIPNSSCYENVPGIVQGDAASRGQRQRWTDEEIQSDDSEFENDEDGDGDGSLPPEAESPISSSDPSSSNANEQSGEFASSVLPDLLSSTLLCSSSSSNFCDSLLLLPGKLDASEIAVENSSDAVQFSSLVDEIFNEVATADAELQVEQIYNSRFAFSFDNPYQPPSIFTTTTTTTTDNEETEPLYQVYHQQRDSSGLQRKETVTSIDSSESQREKRRELMMQASQFGSQRSLWCELPEVRNSGLLDSLSEKDRKLQEALFEIVTSEASYQRSLNVLITHFLASNEFSGKPEFQDILTVQERKQLFSNILPVRDASERLLSALESQLEQSLLLHSVCGVLCDHLAADADVYIKYCSKQIYQERILNYLKQSRPKFCQALDCLERQAICQCLSMRSFLLLPMQRVTRFPLLVDAVFRRTEPEDQLHEPARKALQLANKLVQQCNDGARQVERMEQLVAIDKRLLYGEHMRRLALVSPSRWLVKAGVVTNVFQVQNKGTLGRRTLAPVPKIRTLHLLLLTDTLLITKKRKHTQDYVVLDYCSRNMVEVYPLEPSCPQVPIGAFSLLTQDVHLFMFILMRNHREKHAEFVCAHQSETEKERWIAVFKPPESDGLERIYETWDCPQAICIQPFAGLQDDELRLDVDDVINIFRKMTDGWFEGERLRDGQRGWFPAANVKEILSDHVRAKNFRQRLRFIQAAEDLHLQQQNSPQHNFGHAPPRQGYAPSNANNSTALLLGRRLSTTLPRHL